MMWIGAVVCLIGIAGLGVLVSLGVICALNTLFNLAIPYGIFEIVSVFYLLLIIYALRSINNKHYHIDNNDKQGAFGKEISVGGYVEDCERKRDIN